MKSYKITATIEDNNGVRVMSDNAETLGDVYGMTYLTEEAAKEAIETLDGDRPEGHESVEYEIEEAEFEGFVAGDKYDAQSVGESDFSIDDPGYNIGDYFDATGTYLGPDEFGVEPTHNDLF